MIIPTMLYRYLSYRSEPQAFKTRFVDWEGVTAVDFTRTASSVARTGANLTQWMAKQEVKIDLSAIFLPRQPSMSNEEARQIMDEWNEDLEVMEKFVLEGKKFVRLPENEFGHFYSGDCYVFLCKYWVPNDVDDVDAEDIEHEDEFKCIVYFWQGREASNMGWLTFTFSLQKKFESLFNDKLEVVRTHQQQENLKFLSHFKQKFIIHQGSRKDCSLQKSIENTNVEFFHIRANGNIITTRCIQVKPEAVLLNSEFCYILKAPYDLDNETGLAYVWIGSKADEDLARLSEELALKIYDSDDYRISILSEGEEPYDFWNFLGGKKEYEKDASFMQYTRLFRCSNDKGYFTITEKCCDFCQDDLADDDIMILDNGIQVFIWIGSRCSEVEIKLAYKSAQVYVQNMRIKQPDRPRTLMLTFKGRETRKFQKAFHGFLAWPKINDPRQEADKKMLAILYNQQWQ